MSVLVGTSLRLTRYRTILITIGEVVITVIFMKGLILFADINFHFI